MKITSIRKEPIIIQTDCNDKPFLFKGEYPTLEEMQKAVGGYIQMIYLDDEIVMIMNEEGKLEGLSINSRATNLAKKVLGPEDYIVGDVIIMARDQMEKEEEPDIFISKNRIAEMTAMHPHINFDVTEEDHAILEKIISRANDLHMKHTSTTLDPYNMYMDIAACHCNGCPLKLEKLYESDDFNFTHDVIGIFGHLDRETGKLRNCFLPRFYNSEADTDQEKEGMS